MNSILNIPLKPVTAWHLLYQAALFETDLKSLPQRIADAENAILARAQELFASDADSIEEDLAIDDALYALRALRSCHSQGADTLEASAA